MRSCLPSGSLPCIFPKKTYSGADRVFKSGCATHIAFMGVPCTLDPRFSTDMAALHPDSADVIQAR